jgi:hypothetical protein
VLRSLISGFCMRTRVHIFQHAIRLVELKRLRTLMTFICYVLGDSRNRLIQSIESVNLLSGSCYRGNTKTLEIWRYLSGVQ